MSPRSSGDGDGKSHARVPLASRTRTIARDGTPWGSAGASIGTGVRAELVVMRPRRSSTLARRASVRSCAACVDRHSRCRDGHERGAIAGTAGDVRAWGGVEGMGACHRRHAGGESLRQDRRTHSRGPAQEELLVRTPAPCSPSHPPLAVISTPRDDVAALSHAASAGAAMPLDHR
jgi:hypothetical protein